MCAWRGSPYDFGGCRVGSESRVSGSLRLRWVLRTSLMSQMTVEWSQGLLQLSARLLWCMVAANYWCVRYVPRLPARLRLSRWAKWPYGCEYGPKIATDHHVSHGSGVEACPHTT